METNFDPKQEFVKLRGALKEILDLYKYATLLVTHRIIAELNRVLKPLVFMLGTVTFMVFASGGVALIVESKNGWITAISKTFVYPAYCCIVLVI